MSRFPLALITVVIAAVLPSAAMADGASYNLGAVSDYRYRGISQTNLRPALQGGADYSQGTSYVGTWLSTIRWVNDAGKPLGIDSGDSPVEWDVYLGSKGQVSRAMTYDVGALAYVYLGQKFHNIGLANPNTGEFYGALGLGPLTGKVSISATNLFGVPDSKGSSYWDLNGTFDLGQGYNFVPHVGYQWVRRHSELSYTDFSMTVGKDFGGGLSASLGVVGTNADKNLYRGPSGKFTGRAGAVAGVKYAF